MPRVEIYTGVELNDEEPGQGDAQRQIMGPGAPRRGQDLLSARRGGMRFLWFPPTLFC